MNTKESTSEENNVVPDYKANIGVSFIAEGWAVVFTTLQMCLFFTASQFVGLLTENTKLMPISFSQLLISVLVVELVSFRFDVKFGATNTPPKNDGSLYFGYTIVTPLILTVSRLIIGWIIVGGIVGYFIGDYSEQRSIVHKYQWTGTFLIWLMSRFARNHDIGKNSSVNVAQHELEKRSSQPTK